jgi:hypothetical protein
MPADADVQGGYGAGGVGAGMGSGVGNADPDGPAFDPSAAPVGVNTDTVDIGFDFDNWGGIGIQGASTNQQNTNFDPSAAPVGVNTIQTAFDVDYGYYDNPMEDYASQSIAMQDLDLNYDAVENAMRSPALRGYRSAHGKMSGYGNFGDGFSPMGYAGTLGIRGVFGPSQEETEAIAQEAEARARTSTALGTMEQDAAINLSAPAQNAFEESQQKQMDRALAYEEAVRNMPTYGLGGGFFGSAKTGGKTNPHAPALSAVVGPPVGNLPGQTTESSINTPAVDPNHAIWGNAIAQQQQTELGTPVDPVKQEMQFDFKNFYSALDDEDATEEAKALEVQGFLDHISRKNYTDTGLLSRFGIRSPQLTEREQIAQVKNFLGKHQESIDALNKAYSKQINENPGFRNMIPGYKAITGLMGLIGLEPQHVHPAVQALYDKMVDLGLMEKDRGEMTEAKKAEICNATTGYRWDSQSKSCVPINQDSDGAYNPYLGMTG